MSLGLINYTTGKGKPSPDNSMRPIEVFMCSVVSSLQTALEFHSLAAVKRNVMAECHPAEKLAPPAAVSGCTDHTLDDATSPASGAHPNCSHIA